MVAKREEFRREKKTGAGSATEAIEFYKYALEKNAKWKGNTEGAESPGSDSKSPSKRKLDDSEDQSSSPNRSKRQRRPTHKSDADSNDDEGAISDHEDVPLIDKDEV